MTGRYTLSPRAQSDLDDIWNYTVKLRGIDQAESYVRQIRHHIELVAAMPMLGGACPGLRAGYYKYPSGSHVQFCRLIAGGIDVGRILHERMDVERHF
jgi:toxin ParE1/3/4